MASPADSPESPHTLPRPELNPLLNPLLGDNMGRWAEVYFTSAPEKREEAVIELLRELEAQRGNGGPSADQLPAPPALRVEMRTPTVESRPLHSHLDDLRPCDTCGHANPVTHQFCGMCGGSLAGVSVERTRANEGQNLRRPHRDHAKTPADQEFDDYREPIEEQTAPADEMRPDLYDLSLFQSLRESEYTSDLEYDESPSVRYRYYIAAVLAILILALGYTAWRASRTEGSMQQAQLAPPPAADAPATAQTANQGPPSPTSQNLAKATTQPADSAANNAAPTSQPKPPETPRPVEAARAERTFLPASTSSANPPRATDPLAQQNAANGGDELVMAQHFLSGTKEQGRDSAEAAKWLWKSIAKHNGPAVLVLADLYLKGDGVPKSCDQARVLLDSAARRGTTGAGERLRNLRAFGCQ